MSQPIEVTPNNPPIREVISLILLIIGSILLSVASFLLWGLAGGLFVVGTLLTIVAVVVGYNK